MRRRQLGFPANARFGRRAKYNSIHLLNVRGMNVRQVNVDPGIDGAATCDRARYVSEIVPKVYHSMGGIYACMRAQAMDNEADRPIPGLCAAVRPVTDCIVYGRILGKQVAKDAPWC